MINTQKPMKVSFGQGLRLSIHSMFSTIQGEAMFAGQPAIFVRLAGCTIQCPLCDTEYTQGAVSWEIEGLADHVRSLAGPHCTLVVLTGGEPFRQPISPFIEALMKRDFRVQIEANGTVSRPVPLETEVVCSPKTSSVDKGMSEIVTAWKYVLGADDVSPEDGLPLSSLGMNGIPARPTNGSPVYVQPLDVGVAEENERHTQAAVESCMKYGHRLCIQVHKLVGLP